MQNKNHRNALFFYIIWYLSIFRISVEENSSFIPIWQEKGTLHEDQYTFFIISRRVLLKIKNAADKSCRENQNKHFVFSIFFKSCLYEIKWRKVQWSRPQMAIRPMRIACWMTNATNTHTHTHNEILLAFPLQQWLHKRAPMLRYMNITCLACYQRLQTNRRSHVSPDVALLYVCPLFQLSNVHIAGILCCFRPPQCHAVLHPTVSINTEAHARTWVAGATLTPVSLRFCNAVYPTRENNYQHDNITAECKMSRYWPCDK
jgi:hypothetical protein